MRKGTGQDGMGWDRTKELRRGELYVVNNTSHFIWVGIFCMRISSSSSSSFSSPPPPNKPNNSPPPLSLTHSLAHSTNTTLPPLHTTNPSLSKYPSNSRSTSHSLGGTTSTFPLFISSKCRPTCSNLFSQLSGPWKFCEQKIQRLVVGGRRDWWWQIEASVVR